MFTRKLVGASGGDVSSAIISFNNQTEALQRQGTVKFVYAAKVSVEIVETNTTTYLNGAQMLTPSSFPVYYIYQEIEFEPYMAYPIGTN